MDGFGVDGAAYSLIFAVLAGGFIGASQVNVVLLRRSSSETLLLRALTAQVVFGMAYLAGTWAGWLDLYGTLAVLFGFLCCVGVTNPNASALAIAPFLRNAGSASALLGFFQLGTGAVISTAIGAATPADRVPIVAIFGVTAAVGLAILAVGRRRASASSVIEHPERLPTSEFEAIDPSIAKPEGQCCRSGAP